MDLSLMPKYFIPWPGTALGLWQVLWPDLHQHFASYRWALIPVTLGPWLHHYRKIPEFLYKPSACITQFSLLFSRQELEGSSAPPNLPDGSSFFQPPTPLFLVLKVVFASPCYVSSCGWAERGKDSTCVWIHLGAQSEQFSWAHGTSSCWLMHFNVKNHVLVFRLQLFSHLQHLCYNDTSPDPTGDWVLVMKMIHIILIYAFSQWNCLDDTSLKCFCSTCHCRESLRNELQPSLSFSFQKRKCLN